MRFAWSKQCFVSFSIRKTHLTAIRITKYMHAYMHLWCLKKKIAVYNFLLFCTARTVRKTCWLNVNLAKVLWAFQLTKRILYTRNKSTEVIDLRLVWLQIKSNPIQSVSNEFISINCKKKIPTRQTSNNYEFICIHTKLNPQWQTQGSSAMRCNAMHRAISFYERSQPNS